LLYSILGQIWGNLVTYFVLRDSNNNSSNTLAIIQNSSQSQCGADFAESDVEGTNGSIVISGKTVS
jgi:hypothetical protein